MYSCTVDLPVLYKLKTHTGAGVVQYATPFTIDDTLEQKLTAGATAMIVE